MPRPREKPVNEFIRDWMEREGCKTLKALALKKNLPYQTLLDWASDIRTNYHQGSIFMAAHARGMSPEEFLEALRSGARAS